MVMAAQEKKLTSNLVQILKNASLFLGGLNSYRQPVTSKRYSSYLGHHITGPACWMLWLSSLVWVVRGILVILVVCIVLLRFMVFLLLPTAT